MKKYIQLGKEFLFKNKGATQILFKNTFWLMFAEMFNKGLMLILTIFLARYLGAEGYGTLSFAISFTSLFLVTCDLGLTTLLIRDCSKNPSLLKKYATNILYFKFILSVISFFIILVAISFLDKNSLANVLTLIFAGYIALNSLNEFIRGIFRTYEQMQFEAISIIIRGGMLFLLGGATIIFNLGIVFAGISYLASVAAASLFLFYLAIKKKFFLSPKDFSPNYIFSLLKEAWPMALSFVFVSIYFSIDSVFISHFLGDTQLGFYAVAYTLVTSFYFIPSVLTNVYFPQISKYINKDTEKLKKALKFFLLKLSLSVFPIMLILYLFSHQIITLLFGLEYEYSIAVFEVLLLALVFKFFSFPYGHILVAAGKQKSRLYVQAATALLNIILNVFFIPLWGIMGAAIATVISEVLLCIVYYFLGRKSY